MGDGHVFLFFLLMLSRSHRFYSALSLSFSQDPDPKNQGIK